MSTSLSFTERKLERLKRWTLVFHSKHPLYNGIRLRRTPMGRIRYIGWCNKNNFGDTILAYLFKHYFDDHLVWPAYPHETLEARIDGWRQNSIPGHFVLGGGTLITKSYLQAVERQIQLDRDFFTFGSGCSLASEVATEDADRWSSCLNATPFLGVRGPLSAEMCSTVYRAPHVDIVGDPALAAAELFPGLRSQDDTIRIGINLGSHKFSKLNPNLETMVWLLKKYQDHQVQFIQISMHPIDEVKTDEAFKMAGVQPAEHIRLYDKAATLSEFSTLSLVIGERLHASILAHAYGVPAIGLSYDRKHNDHFQAMNQLNFLIDEPEPREATLTGLVDQTISDHAGLRESIGAQRDVLVEKLRNYISAIKQAWQTAV